MIAQDLEFTTMRLVRRRLLPFLFVLYVFNFIDRTNVGVAALQMNTDLKFSQAVFGFGAGVFFLAYALFEVPSNLVLVRVGARRWIARIMVTWGLVAGAMMFVKTPTQFYAMRLLLGVAEAGFFPGIIYYIGTWFPASYRARAYAAFGVAIPISQVVGAPLGGALLKLDGAAHLAGWQWLFLLEGLPSLLLGIAVLWLLTDRPREAHWLSSEQRAWLDQRLELERSRTAAQHDSPLRALGNPLVWALSVPWFATYALSLGFILWAPLLVRSALGTSNTLTAMITGAMSLVAAAAYPVAASWSDRRDERSGVMAAGLALSVVGCIGTAFFPQSILRVGALLLVGIGGSMCLPAFWCMPARFLRGASAAAGIALINAIGACGGFFGPTIIGTFKNVTGSDAGAFLGLAAIAFIGVCICLRLRRMEVFAPRYEARFNEPAWIQEGSPGHTP